MKYGKGRFDPPLELLAQVKLTGAEFIEVVSSPRGSLAKNEAAGITVAMTLDRLKIRRFGRRGFDDAPQHPQIYMPGHDVPAEWEGVATSLALKVSEDLIAETIGPRQRIVHPESLKEPNKISHLLQMIRFDIRAGSPAGDGLSDFLISEIISSLFSHQQSHTSEQRMRKVQVDAIRDYIEANLSRKLPLSELAFKVGISTRHLCRAFKAETALPPHIYIMHRRVQRACELIGDPATMALSDIAAEVGFASQAHMAWAFRKLLAKTPSQFRKRRD